jgi:uncharacterized membrane protein YeaQ/YmgE (transglycosylase-associated protein family)
VSVLGFFLLLALAIAVRWLGVRLVPLLMPTGKIRTVALGWLGGFLASLLDKVLWKLGPEVFDISLVAAFIGCALFILALGVAPFVKILLGKM